MKDGIPQLADKVDTPAKLYSLSSGQLDALNGMLLEAGAPYSFQHSNDEGHFQVQKVSDDDAEEIASIESLGSNNELGSELYSTKFGNSSVPRRSAVGVMAFLKGRLIETMDLNTKIKMPATDPAQVPGAFLNAVLLGVENDPWKLIYQAVSGQVASANDGLKQVGAPFQFDTICSEGVLAVSRTDNDAGAETVAFIEPVEGLPAFRVSYDDVSVELVLPAAIERLRNRLKEMTPPDVRADLVRLQLGRQGAQPGNAPQPPPPA